MNLNLGIGAACAIALAEAGAAICLVLREPKDETPPNLTTIDAIHNLGATAHVVYCDLDNLDSVKGVFQKALDGRPHRCTSKLCWHPTEITESRLLRNRLGRCTFYSTSVLCFSHYGTIPSFPCVTSVSLLYLFTLLLLASLHRF